MVKNYKKSLDDIIKILQCENTWLTITEIANKIGINRNATAKYLDVLKSQGKVIVMENGPAKEFFLPTIKEETSILDFCSDLIIVVDIAFNVVDINKSFLLKLTKTKEEVIGRKINDLEVDLFKDNIFIDKISLGFSDYNSYFDAKCKIQTNIANYHVKIFGVVQNGIKNVAIVFSNTAIDNSNYLGVDGFFVPLSPSIEYFVVRIRADGLVLFANESYCEPFVEIIKKKFSTLDKNNAIYKTKYIVKKNNQEIWLEWLNIGVFDKNGKLLEVVSIGQDITKIKESENQLEHVDGS